MAFSAVVEVAFSAVGADGFSVPLAVAASLSALNSEPEIFQIKNRFKVLHVAKNEGLVLRVISPLWWGFKSPSVHINPFSAILAGDASSEFLFQL